ncbi:Hypothetical protein FKW44_016089 [Caligus rogercresseyi]|uniref:Uncharacterized protein n=1 Tax=Caligus rogercresseyi TaxID=217165 RepID=A0A7T8H276_CALRO|nr:Hypothetical protein FKW44_016089 [Caligus rogercresseyi]
MGALVQCKLTGPRVGKEVVHCLFLSTVAYTQDRPATGGMQLGICTTAKVAASLLVRVLADPGGEELLHLGEPAVAREGVNGVQYPLLAPDHCGEEHHHHLLGLVQP